MNAEWQANVEFYSPANKQADSNHCISLYACLSVCVSICMSIYPCVRLSVCLYFVAFMSVCNRISRLLCNPRSSYLLQESAWRFTSLSFTASSFDRKLSGKSRGGVFTCGHCRIMCVSGSIETFYYLIDHQFDASIFANTVNTVAMAYICTSCKSTCTDGKSHVLTVQYHTVHINT